MIYITDDMERAAFLEAARRSVRRRQGAVRRARIALERAQHALECEEVRYRHLLVEEVASRLEPAQGSQ